MTQEEINEKKYLDKIYAEYKLIEEKKSIRDQLYHDYKHDILEMYGIWSVRNETNFKEWYIINYES